jgi:hypothetical protein
MLWFRYFLPVLFFVLAGSQDRSQILGVNIGQK